MSISLSSRGRAAGRILVIASIAVSCGIVAAGKRASPPSGEEIPALAAALMERIQDATVELPDGSRTSLTKREAGAVESWLSVERLEDCFATISEADAWPDAWLVVQDEGRSDDLILRIQLAADGAIEPPDPLLAVERRDWDVDSLRKAVREKTGRRARGRSWNLVIQGFSKRVVDRFVYRVPEVEADAKGLMALLPAGSLLREARAVQLPGGRRGTLAVVMQDAEFVPSRCDSPEARRIGHADTGRVFVVLAGEDALEDTVEITARLEDSDGRALLPRYPCLPQDAGLEASAETLGPRFSERQPVDLIHLEDLDGDGLPLEFVLVTGHPGGAHHGSVLVRVDPDAARLGLTRDAPINHP